MIYRVKGKMGWLQFSNLTRKGVVHAFSCRSGGSSSGDMVSLNLAGYVGDCPDAVGENRKRFFAPFEIDPASLMVLKQVHGTEVIMINDLETAARAQTGKTEMVGDAIITALPGLPLVAFAADCQLIYFAVPSPPLVAIAHAGSRGALGGIAVKVVHLIERRYGIKPADIIVGMSPSICKNCYTLDDVMAGQFINAGWGESSYLEKDLTGRWHLNLTAINKAQLLRSGVLSGNISQSGLCTSGREDLFFSYRRDCGKTGRMAGFIMISS